MPKKASKIWNRFGLENVRGEELLKEKKAQLIKRIRAEDPGLLTEKLISEIEMAATVTTVKDIQSSLQIGPVKSPKKKPQQRTAKKNYFKLIYTR